MSFKGGLVFNTLNDNDKYLTVCIGSEKILIP